MPSRKKKHGKCPQTRFDPIQRHGEVKKPKASSDLRAVGDVLKLAVEKHGRFVEGLLDCSNLADIDVVSNYNPNLNSNLWCNVITRVTKESKDCTALTLDRNHIKTLYHLADCLSDGVELESLSLQFNDLQSIADIQKLRPLKIKHLLLAGNPLYKGDKESLFSQIKKALPTLRRLDGVDIHRTSSISEIPIIHPSFDPGNGVHNAVKEFIGDYFQRSQASSGDGCSVDSLLELYDTNSTMSFTCQPKMGMSVSGPGLAYMNRLMREQHNLWTNPGSPNVMIGKLKVGKCLETLHTAKVQYDPESILANTEITQHTDAFVSDTQFPTATMVTVTIHASMTFIFEKKGSKPLSFKKYFDRTWLLTAKSGTPIILNDMLHFRDVQGEKDPVHKTGGTNAYYSLHMRQNDEKVIQLCMNTGIAMNIGRSCLETEEAGPWDVQKAQEQIQLKMSQGVLNQSHFSNIKDRPTLATQIFSNLTRLQPEMAQKCLVVPEVNFDLWKGWALFLVKGPYLTPEMFLPN